VKQFHAVHPSPGLGTHSFRHSYRSWLDSVGTPIGVQQKLMRHTDIRMTMAYGEAFTEDMSQAHSKIVKLAIPNSANGTGSSTEGS
jgi:integrase